MDLTKTLLVKFGWSNNYAGSKVQGDFDYLHEGSGAERYNFSPFCGRYYGYIAPSGLADTARHPDPNGWTVFFIAKRPEATGLHLVGWYEDAILANDRLHYERDNEKISYSLTAEKAILVPPQFRTSPFSHPRIKTLKFSFLRGKNTAPRNWKEEVLHHLLEDVDRLKPLLLGAHAGSGELSSS